MKVVRPMAKGGAQYGMFTKIEYQSATYEEGVPYRDKFPPENRKIGFFSRDCPKRDEFMNIIASERYKETMKNEHRNKMKQKEKLKQLGLWKEFELKEEKEDPDVRKKTLFDSVFSLE